MYLSTFTHITCLWNDNYAFAFSFPIVLWIFIEKYREATTDKYLRKMLNQTLRKSGNPSSAQLGKEENPDGEVIFE